jgi:hypothetical protein
LLLWATTPAWYGNFIIHFHSLQVPLWSSATADQQTVTQIPLHIAILQIVGVLGADPDGCQLALASDSTVFVVHMFAEGMPMGLRALTEPDCAAVPMTWSNIKSFSRDFTAQNRYVFVSMVS